MQQPWEDSGKSSVPQEEPGRNASDSEYITRVRHSEKVMRLQIESLQAQLRQRERDVSFLKALLVDIEERFQELATYSIREEPKSLEENSGALVAALKDINDSVDDMAFRVAQNLPEGNQLSERTLSAFCKCLHTAGGEKLVTLASAALRRGATARDFLYPAITFLFHYSTLGTYVFSPFIPGIPQEKSGELLELYQTIGGTETQERMSGWRVVTYKNGYPQRDDQKVIDLAVNEFISRLTVALSVLVVPKSSATFKLPNAYDAARQAHQVISDAIAWRDKAMTSYLSYDFDTFFVTGITGFDPTCMEPTQPFESELASRKSETILGVGVGLKSWRNVTGDGGKIQREGKVLLKAPVVCGNWLLY